MEHSNIQAAVEAVLFASGEPVESEKLCEAVGIVKDQLEEALGSLADKYSKAESGIMLLSLNGSYQLATKEELATFIKAALEIKKNSVLSPAAMEALTIVAYNQPVTKGFVEHVRELIRQVLLIHWWTRACLLRLADLTCLVDLLHIRRQTIFSVVLGCQAWMICRLSLISRSR